MSVSHGPSLSTGLLLALAILMNGACAQPTYMATDLGSRAFTSIIGTPGATQLTMVSSCDDCTETMTLPFTFDFYGRVVTTVAVSSNGQINMDGSTNSWCCGTEVIPDPNGNDNRIFFAKEDLCPSCDWNSEVWQVTRGTPGSQVWILEFHDTAFCCGAIPPFLNVQVWLYEGSNAIEIYWGMGDTGLNSISAGVEDVGGFDGTPAVSGAYFNAQGIAATYPVNTGCRFDRGDALQVNAITFAPADPVPGGTADVLVEIENNEATPLAGVRVDLFTDPGTPPGPFDQSSRNTVVSLPAGPGATQLAVFPGLTSPVADLWRLYASVNSDSAIPGDRRMNNVTGPVLMGWAQSFTGNCGDCNRDGRVSILDALTGARFAAGFLGSPVLEDLLRCDVDSSTMITVVDALITAQAAAMLGVTLSCPPPPGGPVAEVIEPRAGDDLGMVSPDVVLDLWEAGGAPIDLLLEFSTDAGASFTPCTPDPGSPLPNPALTLPTPALDAVFRWDALADVPQVARPTVGLLRVTASVGFTTHVTMVDPLDFMLLPDFGEEVLLVTGTPDSLDFTAIRWAGRGYPVVQMSPLAINGAYADGAALQAQFWCIWIGCQGTLTDLSLMTMLGPGGKIEDFVARGGILVGHTAHNNAVEVVGPGGFRFRNYLVSSMTDENPQVQDADHEYITGAGYGGTTLTATSFAGWGTTCHGVLDPASFVDAAGINLGVTPMPGHYNNILQSPANGGVPAIMELCHGNGYCLVDGMTFDWGLRGTTPQDSLLQSIQYVVSIRPFYSQ